jgi:dihydropteroate synthase
MGVFCLSSHAAGTKLILHSDLQIPERKITLNCRGRILSLEKPVVMGILNTTPDSFFNESRTLNKEEALIRGEQLFHEGAAIIDIGGYSSRPGATHISEEEEMDRAVPIIEFLTGKLPQALISVDTFRSRVAKAAVDAGACIVNDISAGEDDREMLPTVAAMRNVPYVMMHKQGTPQTMHLDPQYNNVVTDLLDYFTKRIHAARSAGILDVIIDPGFGFGKNLSHNYELLRRLKDFGIFGLPILAGLSRKKMVQRVAGTDAPGALNATSAAHVVALMNGASLLRTHDVKEAVECIKIVNAVNGDLPLL